MARLPILMYHTICNHSYNSKGLTLSYDKLEAQFKYLVAQGYTSLHFRDIEKFKHTNDFPEKPIIITFDDVYVNHYEFAYPLLKKFNLKAIFTSNKYIFGHDIIIKDIMGSISLLKPLF